MILTASLGVIDSNTEPMYYKYPDQNALFTSGCIVKYFSIGRPPSIEYTTLNLAGLTLPQYTMAEC